jgi:hypothetical protein
MLSLDQYLWIYKNPKFERVFYIKLDQPPYYIGNEKFEILNFRPSETYLNTWIGEKNNCSLILMIVDDEEYLKKEYPVVYTLKQKYSIELAYLEINQEAPSNDLYIIGSLSEVEKINGGMKKKNNCVIL